jgi:hypothetical protein
MALMLFKLGKRLFGYPRIYIILLKLQFNTVSSAIMCQLNTFIFTAHD